jgi:hypothetical protein
VCVKFNTIYEKSTSSTSITAVFSQFTAVFEKGDKYGHIVPEK